MPSYRDTLFPSADTPAQTSPNGALPIIAQEYLVEEETLPFYDTEQYFPVHIGGVFNSNIK